MNKKFKTFYYMAGIWVVIFILTLISEARFMARGILPLISFILIISFAYLTISIIKQLRK